MKRIFILFLLLITFSVQVNAGTQNGLKAAFDELNYSLSVEWDQKDQAFFNAQSEKFSAEIIKLQEAGLSNQELMNFTISQIKDQNLAREIQTTFSLVSINAMSSKEAQEHIKKSIEKTYQRGASWNGTAAFIGGTVFALVVLAAVAVIYKDELTKKGEECYMAYRCHEVCELGFCRQVCGEECI
ncbi:hypothetical protein ACJVC5_10415 [Peredibacter sp. HCB2-198]|uniref:hypothetical protein n=1 Tax=Peredibacter sp. HCB2-198 TaxID=3383025 RepID=UPI0038B67CAD